MIYNGINLTNIVQDTKNFTRWSITNRAYELFGKNLNKNQQTIHLNDPEGVFGWMELVFNPKHPAELYLIINVSWSEDDWLKVEALKDRFNTLENRNDVKSAFVQSGLIGVPEDEQRLQDQQRFLNALKEHRGMLSRAVKYTGIPMSTYKKWMSADLNFQSLVNDVAEAIKDDLEISLMDEALEGDVNALKLILAAKAKDRGYGKHEVAKEEVKQELDLNLLTLKEQQQLSKLLQKAQPKQLELQ